MPDIKIKIASAEDFISIKNICCLTGNNGNPIEESRWKFFGDFWIGPYEKYFSEWSFVALNHSNEILGYLVGCPDNLKKNFNIYQVRLMLKFLAKKYTFNSDVKRLFKRFFHLEASPEKSFSSDILNQIKYEYPAHLHINLLPEARGQSIGHFLLQAFEEKLRTENIKGIHVFCGKGPTPYYFKEGFKTLQQIQFQGKFDVFCLGKKI